jgi:metal-sulfur cluster biosynthetic enzyme
VKRLVASDSSRRIAADTLPPGVPPAMVSPTGAAPVSEAAVMQALATVVDPELGMSIVDLGLVYEVRVRDGDVHVTMTLTTPGCPIHEVMPGWVRSAVMAVPGVDHVEVALTFDPPWTPDRIQPPSTRE